MEFGKKLDFACDVAIMEGNSNFKSIRELCMMTRPVTAVILGAGHRSLIYGDLSLRFPEQLKIVAVADIDSEKAAYAAKRYGVPTERIYHSTEELVKAGRIADIVINGTLDELHVPTSLPLLALGYDMLIEKPFATSPCELAELYVAAKRHQNRVFVCHVLRYSSFYRAIHRLVSQGAVGKVLSVNMALDISLHHMIISYVRGQWNNEDKSAPMLLAKCCHDIDLMVWLMEGNNPETVYSVGGDYCFDERLAPWDAGTRCLVDCPREKECPFSAAKHYLGENCPHAYLVWRNAKLSEEEKILALKTDNPFGKCVWKCNHKGVDHQSVTVSFADGAVGVFTFTGGAPREERRIHIVGTEGSISGMFEENRFVLRRYDGETGYTEDIITTENPSGGRHGGGDEALVLDFCEYVRGSKPSSACTELGDSIAGHLVVFAAEKSRKTGKPITIQI